jgi:hypothetical protein
MSTLIDIHYTLHQVTVGSSALDGPDVVLSPTTSTTFSLTETVIEVINNPGSQLDVKTQAGSYKSCLLLSISLPSQDPEDMASEYLLAASELATFDNHGVSIYSVSSSPSFNIALPVSNILRLSAPSPLPCQAYQ